MPNATAEKFGYPATLIAEYGHWLVQLRPAQPTLGALVVICKDKAEGFSAISPEAFAQLARVTADVEQALKLFTAYERINWLMLMMVDRDVHFHVIPRYAGAKSFDGTSFGDVAWPGPPDLASAIKPDGAMTQALIAALKAIWPVRA